MKSQLLVLLLVFLITGTNAQTGVQISPLPIPSNPGAILQVQSANQGVLLPRTTTGSITNPTDGLIVYDTVENHYMYYKENQWTALLIASAFSFSYADRDGDGFGDKYAAIYATSIPMGYVSNGTDCDDENSSVNPGASEICDGIDNDCNNSTPDGQAVVNIGFPCDGPDLDLCEEGVIVCYEGLILCTDWMSGGAEDNPDVCDGIDNDCDPASPDGSEDPLFGTPCDGPDGDLCEEGTWSCVDGVMICSDNTGNTPDICDGINNDCDASSADGSEDPNLGSPCDGPDGDLCEEGTWVCVDGVMICSDNTGNTPEICNDVDDNCNGDIDEGLNLGAPCMVGVGACQTSGVLICDGNGGVVCSALPGAPGTEICGNGIDDDCDGQTDENCVPIDYGVLQFPPSITMPPGNTPFIYGQVFSSGVTNSPGQGAGIMAEVGYGADGSEPSAGSWTWVIATYNTDVGNNDEYQGMLTVNTPGTFDYAYRFSGSGGSTWVYCDLDGTLNGYDPLQAGSLVVEP